MSGPPPVQLVFRVHLECRGPEHMQSQLDRMFEDFSEAGYEFAPGNSIELTLAQNPNLEARSRRLEWVVTGEVRMQAAGDPHP